MKSSQVISTLSAVIVVLAINIYLVNGVGQVYNYNITVKTSSQKFDDHDGKLKLSIIHTNNMTKYEQQDLVLTPNDINIAMNRNYTALVSVFAPLSNITSVYLRWTLASPYNPIYAIKKPSILFDQVNIAYTFVDPYSHMTITQNRKFCPPQLPIAIKHSDGATFYPCI